MTTTVLITGFGRFPGAPFNPSAPLARALTKRKRPAFSDIYRAVHIFETSYAAVDRDLPKLIARHKPDILLMFGLAARTPFVRIETRARNAMSILFPDVSGYRPDERGIVKAKTDAIGAAPFQHLLRSARANRVTARMSRDAGRYLCNYVYWRALEASRSGTPLAQFIHIPPTSNGPRPKGRRRRVSQAALLRAAEAILLALLAARRR
ncbi:MAG TPA: pyroglutamyl-peptidase I [Xanthobacteraceae bacterium]|jgi:pyroglutamyl-peptidase|nr:pyroglutamyl-peptidase I [Xanthobacteraceae bacterium]